MPRGRAPIEWGALVNFSFPATGPVLPLARRKISKAKRRRLLERAGFQCERMRGAKRCWNTGGDRQGSGLQLHHKTPVAAGGDDSDENLEVVCKPCHPEADREAWAIVRAKAEQLKAGQDAVRYTTHGGR